MPISISMIALSSQLVVTVADRVPTFDVVRSCKLDVAATAGLASGSVVQILPPMGTRLAALFRHGTISDLSPLSGELLALTRGTLLVTEQRLGLLGRRA